MQAAVDVRVADLRRQVLALPSAARVLDMPVATLRKTVDRGWLKPTYIQTRGRRIRALTGTDIVCLIISRFLTTNVRNLVCAELRKWPDDRLLRGTVVLMIDTPTGRRAIEVSLDGPVSETLSGIEQLNRGINAIDAATGTIRGTEIDAARIAALVEGGMSFDEILRDYPNLARGQIEAAVEYTRIHPHQGRPFPKRTVKSVLRAGKGGLGKAFAAARESR